MSSIPSIFKYTSNTSSYLKFIIVVIVLTSKCMAIEDWCPLENSVPSKLCMLRDYPYGDNVWKYFAGYYCYVYTDPKRFEIKYNTSAAYYNCLDNTIALPVLQIDGKIFLFDYENVTAMNEIKTLFRTDAFFEIFFTCCIEAVECCMSYMDETNTFAKLNPDKCTGVWDGWSCFPVTPVNTIAKKSCSIQAYQSPEHVCALESEKTCFYNSTLDAALWVQQTNYAPCLIAPIYEKRHEFHIIVLYCSTFFSLPAIVIFLIFKRFREDKRVIFHRNLLTAICVRNVFTIMSKSIILIDALQSDTVSNHVMENNGVACRILASFENAAKNAIYATMLIDGFYLHKLIVRAFANDPNIWILHGFVLVLSCLPTLIWAITMHLNGQENCWMVDGGEQWIVDGIRIGVLVINALLLMDIIRILISKINKRSPSRQTKAAFRATLFLIPLFGVHIAVTAKKIVIDDTCESEDVYNYIKYSIEGIQGMMVAVLFCYINTEVHNQFKNAYRKFSIYVNQKYGISMTRASGVKDRRFTTATFIQSGRLSQDFVNNVD